VQTRITYGSFGFFSGLISTAYPEEVTQRLGLERTSLPFNKGSAALIIGNLIPIFAERNTDALQFYIIGLALGAIIGTMLHIAPSSHQNIMRIRP
jgi:hypothetical protein